jgi:hypothetical protein
MSQKVCTDVNPQAIIHHQHITCLELKVERRAIVVSASTYFIHLPRLLNLEIVTLEPRAR